MISLPNKTQFLFDSAYLSGNRPVIDNWLYGCVFLTTLYVTFALLLIGVPGLARGGIVSVLLCVAWVAYGVLYKKRYFPVILYVPLAFYIVVFSFGFIVYDYPVEAVGKLTTAWLGAIAIAAFVANGLSLRFVVSCFLFVIIANLFAYAIGYDGRAVHVLPNSEYYNPYAEIRRVTALVGQTNLLVAFAFTFPFLLFLFRKRFGLLVLLGNSALCITFMFLTASRSTLPFSFLFFGFGFLLFIRTSWVQAIVGAIGMLILCVCAYIILSHSVIDILSNSLFGEIHFIERILEALYKESGSVEDRLALAKDFVPHFVEKPFIGYGPDQFKDVAGHGLYAHNNFAELLINYGLLGSMCYYSMYIIILFNIVKYSRHNIYLIAPLIYLISTEFVFVTHVERPLILLLCLMLVASTNFPVKRRRHLTYSL